MVYFILYIYILLGQSIIHFQGLLGIKFKKANILLNIFFSLDPNQIIHKKS